MNPHENERHEDERLAALFTSACAESASPDEELLERLREQSTKVFAEASPQQKTPLPRRNRRMVTLVMRGLAAAVAASVVLASTLWFSPSTDDAALAFGKVLQNVASAESLHLQITQDGQSTEAWAKPGQLRWNQPDGTYRIARGGRLWSIDERANRATSGPTSYFHDDKAGLDLLALLELPADQRTKDLLDQRPAQRVEREGVACDVYRIEIPAGDGTMQLEALVEVSTRRLRWVETKARRNGRLEPITKIELLAINEPVDETLFVVGDTLTEDGRIGKISDVQGIASIKPVMHSRWTPVGQQMPIKPGDWLRTDARGANAAAVRLVSQVDITLGPGSLVELAGPSRIRLIAGELKIVADAKTPLEVLGPNGQTLTIKSKRILRLDKEQLVDVKSPPLWLRGFEGTTTDESLGSLVAKVDGRDVPLTVGYHKVSVDIRDQIARTVVEESFVNHTKSQLEGVFYFPLPQDASISGFGMWIGDELVEADVVEKQRAREIYETILRERRDPGLLEWTGGNIFKARVFPIFPHSEKRIKITYTQVLPLRENRYRYSYALQSEMLKQFPLRELSIDVKISSEMPLASVTSPTHTTRIDRTTHSAHVEFSAQEYTPTRDFEVIVEIDGGQSSVTMIPHRRGEDGYFMLQLTPPSESSQWQRDILPDGEPIELLVLADTSASIDDDGRKRQAQFVAALLSSLTADDRLNLATCDVDCNWVFEKSLPANEKNIDIVRGFLAGRISLGWTDLDKTFASALKRCGPKTHLIYIGDGIPTTTDGDPVALGKRLKRLFGNRKATCHAVALGSSFEPIVLKSIASLGGGSMRQIGGERGPQAVALELLGEITRPGLRDLKVRFEGLRTARVYPEQLPNLAAGTQQILLGRYLPEGQNQSGRVIVTGMQGDRPIRFSAELELEDAEQGNSFIPRLWARMYLDELLEQGTSSTVKDEIIGLSEEYHIMTPYTSLLVLESDKDRERFKVNRRFQMRDGERFFAEGRDRADYELVQQQMRRAGDWRIGLRRDVLRRLAGLGRHGEVFQAIDQNGGRRSGGEYKLSLSNGSSMIGYDISGKMGGGFSYGGGSMPVRFDSFTMAPMGGPVSATRPISSLGYRQHAGERSDFGDFFNGDLEVASQLGIGDDWAFEDSAKEEGLEWAADDMLHKKRESAKRLGRLEMSAPMLKQKMNADLFSFDFVGDGYDGAFKGSLLSSRKPQSASYYGRDSRSRRGNVGFQYGHIQWLDTLFPRLSPAPTKEMPLPPEQRWPAAARKLAESLLRTRQLAALDGGLRIERRSETFDVRWDRVTSRSETTSLVSPDAWAMRSRSAGSQTLVNWCDDSQRGIFSRAFRLGRVRMSTELDRSRPPLGLGGYVLRSLERSYATYSVELRPQGDGRTLVVLTHPNNPTYESHILVDTERHVVVSIQRHNNGRITSTETFGRFVERAGSWWATKIETVDADGRRTSLVTQTFTSLADDPFEKQFDRQLAELDSVQLLSEPQTTVLDAKRALAAGKADFDDQLAMLLHFAATGQWPRVMEHLQQIEELTADKPGVRWIRDAILKVSRHREKLRGRLMDEAAEMAQPRVAGQFSTEELFLANHLLGQASGVLEANEMLALLDALKPVFGRQAAHAYAEKAWKQQRINYLQQTGQTEDALALQKELAVEYPHHYGQQQQYAQGLVNSGDYKTAYAWLNRVLGDESRKWLDHERDSLRGTVAQFLRQQGRYDDLCDWLVESIEQNPDNGSNYQQYLSALTRADRTDEVNELIGTWLAEGRTADALPQDVTARLSAAIPHAMGQGYNLYTNRLDERWLDPLAEVALFFARHKTQPYLATRIMTRHQFQQSDQCRSVRRQIARVLKSEIDTLSAEQVGRFVNWIRPNDPAVETRVWKQIAAELQRRWSAESDEQLKNQLAQPLIQILSSKIGADEHLAFLRRQLAEGPKDSRPSYANQLFNVLLSQPWSAEYEDEAFGLIGKLSDAEDAERRLVVQVQAVYRMTDAMVQTRYQARMKKVEHPEELTRTELRDKQTENLRLAREGFADRLKQATRKTPGLLARWFDLERLYLETRMNRNLQQVEDACWEHLGPNPPQTPETIEEGKEIAWQLEQVFTGRMLTTMTNLMARRDAKPESVDRFLAYIDRAVKANPKDIRWKVQKYQMLVALDRPKDLEKALRQWIRPDEPDSHWRRALGYLLAEGGKLPEAIDQFELIEAADELGPTEYRTLADWYMAVDEKEKHERALIAVFKTMDEWRMSNWISAKLQPWQRSDGQMPNELDKNVLRMFTALFEKSASPQNHLYLLQRFYKETHEFRLLAGLADGVIGHTAGRIYPFLQGMSGVLSEVRDEATADKIVERLAIVRDRATTTIDHRALDLLEMLVERRSSEVLNQPGPHVDLALAAMQRAFRREWSDGEPRLMADLLSSLGRITQEKLAAEQIRELETLHRRAEAGSIDRLHIAHRMATAYWSYSRYNDAIDLLHGALVEYENACDGILPQNANEPLDTFISYLEQRGHHARGENGLFEQLEHPINRQQTYWLTQRLYQLYEHAVRNDGHVSLGAGQTLYETVDRNLQKELDTNDQNHRYALINRLCTIYRAAHDRRLDGVAQDIVAFGKKRLPEVLRRQTNNYQSAVSQVAHAIHDVAGARAALAFLIERIEDEPTWFRYSHQDGWSQHGYRLGQWRRDVGDIGDLEQRLLAIVTAELRRDLETRQQRNRNMYHNDHSYFWKEMESAFAATVEEVHAERKQSGAAVQYMADYLFHGLNHYDRAIEMLLIAHKDELLDEAGQSKLVDFLHRQSRYGESIAILEPLIETRPDNMQYRVWLLHAYFRTDRPDQLLALLKQTDEHFHEGNRWQEAAMAALAYSCLNNRLYEPSAAYYEELIPLHQRTQPGRGIGNGTLSSYYGYLADAYAGLKKTAKAVDAASGAIVAWGPRHSNRRSAIETLKRVLRNAPDRDAFAVELDRQAEETGLDNPIVRKALGQVYLEQRQYAKAIEHLKLACETQPNDTETHRALVQCFDQQQDKEGAIAQLLASLQLSRRDITLYEDLGRRYEQLERSEEAERAHTSIVEMLPSESESHTLLAEIRQRQDRWDDAIVHWQQVARIRQLEPTGLTKLAEAQIHQKQWDAAAETVKQLDGKGWPSRFGDVYGTVRSLEQRIDAGRPKP